MKKGLCLLFAAILLLGACGLPVRAADTDEIVWIADNTYFDQKEGKFLYYIDSYGALAIRSSVADGMVTAETVTIKSDPGVAMEVYRNGELAQKVSGGGYQQPGEYVVMYVGGRIAQRVFAFTIVPSVTNSIRAYSLPLGFEFTDATLNGQPVSYERDFISLAQEGEYDLHFRCTKTGVPYQLTFCADYTGPQLALTGVTDGVARGPVDISEAKEAAAMQIFLDGEKIAKKDVLTESGEYYIELADEAGNKTTYSFTILVYFDGNSWLFILILLLAAVAVVVYLLHARKHLRVR